MQNQKQIKKGRSNDKERVKKDLIRFTKKVNSMVVQFFLKQNMFCWSVGVTLWFILDYKLSLCTLKQVSFTKKMCLCFPTASYWCEKTSKPTDMHYPN